LLKSKMKVALPCAMARNEVQLASTEFRSNAHDVRLHNAFLFSNTDSDQ
jgi:hypothetical protein